MKIYTKTGDGGETGLLGGPRVKKDHWVVEVCGSLDELNSLIGLTRSGPLVDEMDAPLGLIQNWLFDLGSRIAACMSEESKSSFSFPEKLVAELEAQIDKMNGELPKLTAFILPGGSIAGSRLHLARAVCRRSERRLVALMEAVPARDLNVELAFLNRLSDFLFVLARLANLRSGTQEVHWKSNA